MNATILHPFQVDIPDILKCHTGDTKGMGSGPFQEQIHAVRLNFLSGATAFTAMFLYFEDRLKRRPVV